MITEQTQSGQNAAVFCCEHVGGLAFLHTPETAAMRDEPTIESTCGGGGRVGRQFGQENTADPTETAIGLGNNLFYSSGYVSEQANHQQIVR